MKRFLPLLLLPLSLAAEDREAPLAREGVRAAVEVTAMDLDVVATKGGEPVTDLTKNELVVRVDGKVQPIDYFARIDAGTLHGPDLKNASPDVILETTRGDAGDRYLPRQFFVFFDDEHLTPPDRKKVIEGLRDFVTRLTPSDRVAIASHNIGSTHVLVPFTSSKEALLGGLAKLEKTAPRGIYWNSQYREDVLLARRSRPSSRDAIIRSYAEQILSREKGTLEDLRRAVAALAARSGKRVLIYVSDGIELHPGQSFTQALGPTLLNQFDYSVMDQFQKVVTEANASGVTIHALDGRGLTTDVDASEQQASVFDAFATNANQREALAGFAAETGGILVETRNAFQTAFDRIYRDASTYYSVGVTLASLDPKKPLHTVEVTTTRPGVVVQTRRSYTAKTAGDAALDRLEMALLTPDAHGDFPVQLEVGPPKKGGGLGHRLAAFAISVPLSALTFVDEGGKKKASVEVALAAVEDDGARSQPTTDRKTIIVDPAQWEKEKSATYRYTGELKARKGNMRFVATVRDVPTNRVGLGTASVRIE